MGDQSFCLRWDNHHSSVTSVLAELRELEELFDVTLCCDDFSIRAHRLLLSACSPYLRRILKSNPCQHMVFYMKDTSASDLRALVEFMYRGSVNVSQSQLASFIKTAESLQIRGLSGDEEKKSSSRSVTPPVHQTRSHSTISNTAPPTPVAPPPAAAAAAAVPITAADTCSSELSAPAGATRSGQLAKRARVSESPAAAASRSAPSSTPTSYTDSARRQSNHSLAQSPSLAPPTPALFTDTAGGPSTSAGPSNGAAASARRVSSDTASSTTNPQTSDQPAIKVEKIDLTDLSDMEDTEDDGELSLGRLQDYADLEDMEATAAAAAVAASEESGLPAFSLAAHNSLSTGDVTAESPHIAGDESSTAGDEVGIYPCGLCNRHYATKAALSDHRKTHIGHNMCVVCGRSFGQRSHLRRHIMLVHHWSRRQVIDLLPHDPPGRRPRESLALPQAFESQLAKKRSY